MLQIEPVPGLYFASAVRSFLMPKEALVPRLEIRQTPWDSHFPPASAAAVCSVPPQWTDVVAPDSSRVIPYRLYRSPTQASGGDVEHQHASRRAFRAIRPLRVPGSAEHYRAVPKKSYERHSKANFAALNFKS